MGNVTSIVCLECGQTIPGDRLAAACPACRSPWLDARYDYAAVAARWANGAPSARASLWRYSDLLPIDAPDPEITLDEGFTPLLRLYPYERDYGHTPIFVKDERQGPTGSFKDRQAAVAVTALKAAGVREIVLASTGNAAAAYAAYCARAGIKLWLFLTYLVPSEKLREAALYGAQVVKVSGTYDQTKTIAAAFADQRGIHFDKGAKAIPGKESMKTLGFEIAEQLGLAFDGAAGRWVCPDWYIQAVSGGIGPLGVWKGFHELYTMGLIDRLPKLGIIQAAGCAPMVQAFAAGQEKATPVTPQTLITVLATGDPGFAYIQLNAAIRAHGGAMVAIEDGETFAAMRRVASRAGLSVEPATAVAFAGLERLLSDGVIAPGEIVVVNASGHTFPAESHILGDQYLLNLDLQAAERQHEGLRAAFKQIDEQVTTILVADDNPNDRRLIRRLLQAHKQYRVFEAKNGEDALSLARAMTPDLIVADLTMPQMDGFSLIEQLKDDPLLQAIPVIIVSAKSLTDGERALLAHHSESVWTKGGFSTRDLVDHIIGVLGDTPYTRAGSPRDRLLQASDTASTAPQHVVIIDDNADDLRLATRWIEKAGNFTVTGVTTGREGLKRVHELHPDLVLLDLHLPDMNGWSIVETIRHDPDLFDIPIILYSADTSVIDADTHTVQGVVCKEVNMRDALISTIQQALLTL